MLKAFLNDQSGTTTIEYGFVAGLVSIAILATLVTLGGSLDIGYGWINDQMVSAIAEPAADQPGPVPTALVTDETVVATLR